MITISVQNNVVQRAVVTGVLYRIDIETCTVQPQCDDDGQGQPVLGGFAFSDRKIPIMSI